MVATTTTHAWFPQLSFVAELSWGNGGVFLFPWPLRTQVL